MDAQTVTLVLTAELREAVERVRATGVTACENDARGVIADAVVAATAPLPGPDDLCQHPPGYVCGACAE